jgi:hypothetical protein
MKKKFKITEQQAQKILKLNGATQQAPNPCNQFIAQVVPSQGGGGDIDCCKMLNGDMVGPYGNTAGSQMLQTHCDVAWSMAVMGGTFNDGNQLGGSLAWADCCKNDTTTGEDKWLCEGGECYNHPSGTYTSLPDCEKNCGRSNTGNGGGCSDDVCPNPNHVKTPFNPDGSGCKCECTNRYQQCEAPWVWDENKCTCAEPTDFAPDLQSKKLAPPETKDQKELREEMTRIKELLK